MLTTFRLRSFALDDDAQGCRFDATPSEFELLGRGTPEVITDFLLTLKIEAEPKSWSITPFRTHYYSQFPDAEAWRDVFPRAFEVRVRFTKPFVGPRPEAFRQFFSSASDLTWDARQLPLDWARGRFIIVTDCFRRTRDELLAALDGKPALKEATERVELVPVRADVLQMRMDLGQRNLPDDKERVYSLMEDASYFCRTFLWSESVTIA